MGYLITKKPQATINLTADEWDLYSHEPGAEEAACAMSDALQDAINTSDTEAEAQAKAWPTWKKYADLGATDSEPMWKLERILQKAYRQ
jgi:hypothetical protein